MMGGAVAVAMVPSFFCLEDMDMRYKKDLLVMAVCLSVFVVSCFSLMGIWLMYTEGTSEYEGLREYVEETAADSETDGEPAEEPETAAKVDFDALKKINPDIVAWIRIEGLGIDYPVVQGEDNEHYLNYTFRGEKNAAGSIFLDCRNQADFSDPKIILYGHNMKNGSMFGSLKKYQEDGVLSEAQVVTIYLPGGEEWKFEVKQCRTVESNDACYELEDATGEEPDKKELILSTCSYRSDVRLIVETSGEETSRGEQHDLEK